MIRDRGEPASAPDYPVLYAGHTGHYRFHPREHEFRKPVRMVHVDVDRLTELDDLPTWSATGTALMTVRVRDHLDGSDAPLGPRVRDLVRDELGWRPQGRITLLTQPRTWGYVFNPISIYYCWSVGDAVVDALVLEVTNTPWHERHIYVVDARDSRTAMHGKELHVSPFMPMNQEYRFAWSDPAESLRFSITVLQDGARVFSADLDLSGRSLTRGVAARAALTRPWSTLAVTAGIHLEAAKLWLKGVPFHGHPRRSGVAQSAAETDPAPALSNDRAPQPVGGPRA